MTKFRFILIFFLALTFIIVVVLTRSKSSMVNPLANLTSTEVTPSSTVISYEDPIGFKFDYPDNISLSKAEIEDPSVYTDLSLYSKEINGSVSLNISETKLKSIDAWISENKLVGIEPSTEVMLGNLKATEIKTSDHLYLSAIDQGSYLPFPCPDLKISFGNRYTQKLSLDFLL